MIPAGLAAALQAFDEAALTLLANKGLVRRARRDVDEGLAAIQGVDGDAVRVACDSETVRLDKRGPAFAACTCPAPGICRHRLAAVICVQAADVVAEAAAPDVSAEIAAAPVEDLRKWAGKAAWRAALALADGAADVSRDGQAFVVALPDDAPVVRILPGQGFDGMVSKAAPGLRKAVHAAAWLVARHSLGLEDAVTDADSGSPAAEGGVDPVFLDTVTAGLEEYARLGLNLAPVSLEERLFVLSVSSRADALPRLAALLRTLSAQVRSRRRRDFSFDSDASLETCAETFALVSALRVMDETTAPDRRVAMLGTQRRDYAAGGELQMVGFGADAWTTASGARGVTGYFYEPGADRWLTASLARGANQDPGFDPLRAYRTESLWGTMLERMSHAQVLLENAMVSDDGRLSAAGGVKLSAVTPRDIATIDAWPCLFDDWAALKARLRERLGGDRRVEPVLLRPQGVARPSFDDLTQVLTWPVRDNQGRWLAVSMEHGRARTGLLDALQSVADSGWSGTVVALASVQGRRFVLRPIALIDREAGYNVGLDNLGGLASGGVAQKAGLWLRDMKAALARYPKAFAAVAPSRSAEIVHSAWHALVETAEIGSGHAAGTVRKKLEGQAHALAEAGFQGLSDVARLAASAIDPKAFLTAAYAVSLARRSMVELPYLMGR